MTGRLGFGRTLYYRRPAVGVITDDGVCIDAATPIDEASLEVLSTVLGASDDVLVRFATDGGTVPARMLLQHLKHIYRERAEEVVRRKRRLQAMVENAGDVIDDPRP